MVVVAMFDITPAKTSAELGSRFVAALQDEAGDSQLQFTETADLCEVVDRSGPDAFNSPLVKDATEVLIERFSASPQPCADEAAVEESQLLLTEDLPPELRQDVTCNEAAGSNQVNMSFPLQGGTNSCAMISYPSLMGSESRNSNTCSNSWTVPHKGMGNLAEADVDAVGFMFSKGKAG